MKTVKRALLVVLALAMALSAAACGGNGGSGSGSGNGPSKPADTSYIVDGKINNENLIAMMPKELKGTTIKFYNWYDPYELEQEGTIIDEFQEKFGVKVDLVLAEYQTYNDYLAGLMATGDAPDVMRMLAPSAAMLKALQPLKNSGFIFDESVWHKDTMDFYSVDGIAYGTNLINTAFYNPDVIFYNSATMKEMGYDDPYEMWKKGTWTWDAFNKMCKDWIKQGSDYYGAEMWPRGAVPLSAGKDLVEYDGKNWKLSITDETLLAAWRFTTQGVKDRVFGGLRDTMDASDQKTLFTILDATGLAKSSTNNYFRKIKAKGNLGFAPLPKWKNQEYITVCGEYLAYGFCKGCKNIQAAPYFLAYFMNMDNYVDDGKEYWINQKAADMMATIRTYPQICEMSLEIGKADQKWFPNDVYNNSEPAQLITYLQSYEPVMQRCLDIHNETVKNVEK